MVYVKFVVEIYVTPNAKAHIKLIIRNKIYFRFLTTGKIFLESFAPPRYASAKPMAKMARKKKEKNCYRVSAVSEARLHPGGVFIGIICKGSSHRNTVRPLNSTRQPLDR